MAEDRSLSQRHSHELSSASYGHFGTPVYDERSQTWTFSRRGLLENRHSDGEVNEQRYPSLLKPLTTPRSVVKPSHKVVFRYQGPHALPLIKERPELAPISSLIKAANLNKPADELRSHQDSLIAFGSATWLGIDGLDSGGLFVPIAARATGTGRDTLSFTCLNQEHHELILDGDTLKTIQLPSLAGVEWTTFACRGPILQISFSRLDSDGRGNNLLCVRQASQTSVFEPLLRRDNFAKSSGQTRSPLDPNLLVTIDASATGGYDHVDAHFHPHDHRKLAVVDEQGNWSVWQIRGRRSVTARVLYQARLKTSGKVFSWKHRKRPEGVGLYFDGWHKILWTSSNGQIIDRLLVCNRQSARIFDLKGEELISINLRLDVNKANSYILDACLGPKVNLCLILTTSRFLVFDIAKKKWKDPANDKEPALLCSFCHMHNPAEAGLKMANLFIGESIILGLFSAASRHMKVRQLILARNSRGTSVVVSDPSSLLLSIESTESPLSTILLTRSESAILGSDQLLVYVFLQHEDLSVSTFLTAATPADFKVGEICDGLLRLPPKRSTHVRSERRIDDLVNEDDLTNFIVSDCEIDETKQESSDSPISSTTWVTSEASKTLRHVAILVDTVRRQRHVTSGQTSSMGEVVENLQQQFQNHVTSDTNVFPCETVLNTLRPHVLVVDMEGDSATLGKTRDAIIRNLDNLNFSLCLQKSDRSLLETYGTLFSTFIGSLPADFPDRFRVQKERQDRRTALEQYLSSYSVYRSFPGATLQSGRADDMVDNPEAVLDDPIEYTNHDGSNQHTQSRSQPPSSINSTVTSGLRTDSSPTKSTLNDALSRISCFTRITPVPAEAGVDTFDIQSLINPIILHLPASFNIDPDEYDYRSIEESLVAEEAHASVEGVHRSGRSRRKADKSVRAQVPTQDADTRFSATGSGETKETKLKFRESDVDDRRSQSRKYETMPIRTSETMLSRRSLGDPRASDQQAHVLSDGDINPQTSSQPVASHDAFTLTQPERGTFANRPGANSQGQVKKKKKRMAGF